MTEVNDELRRITPALIEQQIVGECYIKGTDASEQGLLHSHAEASQVSLGLLTICVLVLKNGFTVTGESACADPATYDYEIGKTVARQNAINKVWPLMGYQLRSRLAGVNGLT